MTGPLDAVVVGSGPNGLAAALTLAGAGLSVRVYEGAAAAGGGCRTEELTLPGFRHDVCAAVHPLAAASPFFRAFDLAAHGVRLRQPEIAFGHPLDRGRAGVVLRSVDATAAGLGADAGAYRRLVGPLAERADLLVAELLRPPLRGVPRHPVALGQFAVRAARPAAGLVARRFSTDRARALLAGAAGHAMLPMTSLATGAFGLLLTTLAHAVGWPVVEGGSGRIVAACLGALRAAGAEVVTGQWVRSLRELPPARAVLLDVAPRQLLDLAGDRLPGPYARALRRFRHGPGVCKVDYALAGPVPWAAAGCRRAGTVHLGGTFEEIARAEAEVAAGRHPQRPYVLLAQPGVVDAGRAPAGLRTLWAYCHVPAGSPVDMAARIDAQIERFAPGFRDLVLACRTTTAVAQEAGNPSRVGGDITGGAYLARQILFRPAMRWNPYTTGLDEVYLCSASTPPGAGVHGMAGWHAARTALRRSFGIRLPAIPA